MGAHDVHEFVDEKRRLTISLRMRIMDLHGLPRTWAKKDETCVGFAGRHF